MRLTVEDDDLDDVGHVVTVRPQLLDLAVVLGEHEPRPGVTQDVGDILGHRCGVDRRRRTAGTHDAEVGQGPLVARGRGDRHPVLDGEAERHQAGSHVVNAVAGGAPRDALEMAVVEVLECFAVPRAGHPVTEESGDAAGSSFQDVVVDALVHG